MEFLKKMVGHKIRTRREEMGLTQSQLASALGCDQPTISHWEKGNHLPKFYLPALCKALKVDETYFGEEAPPAQTVQDLVKIVSSQEKEIKALKKQLASIGLLPDEVIQYLNKNPKFIKGLQLIISGRHRPLAGKPPKTERDALVALLLGGED